MLGCGFNPRCRPVSDPAGELGLAAAGRDQESDRGPLLRCHRFPPRPRRSSARPVRPAGRRARSLCRAASPTRRRPGFVPRPAGARCRRAERTGCGPGTRRWSADPRSAKKRSTSPSAAALRGLEAGQGLGASVGTSHHPASRSRCGRSDVCRSVFDQTLGPRAPPGAQQRGDLPERMRTIEARLEPSSRPLIGPSIDEPLRLIQALSACHRCSCSQTSCCRDRRKLGGRGDVSADASRAGVSDSDDGAFGPETVERLQDGHH
jgi:hypothetical protein